MYKETYKNKNLSVSGLQWKLKKNIDDNLKKIEKTKNISEVIKNILLKRDLFAMEIHDYLSPSLNTLTPDPINLHDMSKAVTACHEAIIKNQNIGILGDYDVDGATSSALIFNYLSEVKVKNLDVFIPDRETDGYGLTKNAIDFFSKKKTNLILCLDCGTNDIQSIARAFSFGIKVIIIDHHEQKKESDKVLALINPKKNQDNSGLNYLATVGLSFLFIIALNSTLRKKNFFNKERTEPNLKKYLDLVALGTICDLVPLKSINRLFVKKGILELNKGNHKGINTLIKKLNINKILDVSDISFYIGPCINAPGRIGDSSLGFRLLSTRNENSFSEIADLLLKNNKERKTLENIACKQAKNKITVSEKIHNSKFILLYDQNWHPGIIGIIASRLTKEFKLPSIVISLKENNSKGSIRSVEGVNAAEIIDFLQKKKCIISGGGHSMAGRFTLKEDSLDNLDYLLKSYFSNVTIKKKDLLEIDIILDLYSINTALIKKIKEIGPFGQENEEPMVMLNNLKPAFIKRVGKFQNHIFCILEDIYGNSINAVAFNQASTDIGNAIYKEKLISVAGKLEIYKTDEKKTPQIIIEDILIL